MSGMDGPADETDSIATIHAALDASVTLLDSPIGARRPLDVEFEICPT